MGAPWRVAFALQAEGWWLRSDIIWKKENPMPESVTDRPTKAHEYLFLLTKSATYYYDAEAVKEASTGRDSGNLDTTETHQPNGRSHRRTSWPYEGNGYRNLRDVWTIATQPFSGWTPTVRRVPVPSDAGDGDTKRTTSPDCPLHGGPPDPASSDGDGERGDGLSSHTERNDDRHVQELLLDSEPTEPIRELGSEAGSSDSPHLVHAQPASGRNTGTHRTALAPATTPPYTPSAQTSGHIGDMSTSPDSAGSAGHISESRTEQDDSGDHPSAGTSDHTAHTSSCSCSFYKEITEQTSHFATFPKALVEPCIKAGTSEKGCCPECRAPWVREVERGALAMTSHTRQAPTYRGDARRNPAMRPDAAIPNAFYPSRTSGWRSTCTHDAEPIPQTVLDPFCGSGTAGVVAVQLGRSFIGIDLNPTYCDMAERRIHNEAGLFSVGTP